MKNSKKTKLSENVKELLQFKGNPMYYSFKDGQWWIAIKPICEVLEVDYINAAKHIKKDRILSQLWSDVTIVAADGKDRKMTALPERYIYGWLFALQSKSPKLLEYKLECYDVLFNYFHGAITQRTRILQEKIERANKIKELEQKLKETEPYKKILQLKEENKISEKELKRIDHELLQPVQLDLFN